MNKQKVIMCWSGGKDSSLCLEQLLKSGPYQVTALLSNVNGETGRVSMHGVRESLADAQAAALGIPLRKIYFNEGTNREYERKFSEVLLEFREQGIIGVVFGDIFLEELRAYRDKHLASLGMKGIYPLWKMCTKMLASRFLVSGYKAVTCCVNDGYLGEEWVGRELNGEFFENLPDGVDLCGENGEYHSFCYDGPIFKQRVSVSKGEKVYRELTLNLATHDCSCPVGKTKGFWYCDLVSSK